MRVLSLEQFAAAPAARRFFNVAVADGATRMELVRRCLQAEAAPFGIVSPHSLSYYGNTVGEGAILCAYTMITSNARVGRYFHANIYSYVAHDCVIGDYVIFAPAVRCNGRVIVEDHAYIGTSAVIRNGEPGGEPMVIGRGAVVGMGAGVTRNVPPGITVAGNPARPLPRR
jgi:sugar O-acyltransferase (sialic acid O-acetyltransferase NeuD family)